MQHEHELVAAADVQPGERQVRVGGLQYLAVVADLDDQQAVCAEMLRGVFEDDARRVQPAAAAAQSQFRLVQLFRRQRGDRCGVHVGRVADD